MRFMRQHALYFAWVIALGGSILSLYFGELSGNEPCPLCWYQRIALFPLAIMLGIAAYRDDRTIVRYALPLVGLGVFFALYQILEPHLFHICGEGDCMRPMFFIFGFLSFPILSALGFCLIGAFLLLSKK